MKKTVYISKTQNIGAVNARWEYSCPYAAYLGGKWREDTAYFNDPEEFKRSMKKQGFKIE